MVGKERQLGKGHCCVVSCYQVLINSRLLDRLLMIDSLPRDHPYVQMELDEMRDQLENEVRVEYDCYQLERN